MSGTTASTAAMALRSNTRRTPICSAVATTCMPSHTGTLQEAMKKIAEDVLLETVSGW